MMSQQKEKTMDLREFYLAVKNGLPEEMEFYIYPENKDGVWAFTTIVGDVFATDFLGEKDFSSENANLVAYVLVESHKRKAPKSA